MSRFRTGAALLFAFIAVVGATLMAVFFLSVMLNARHLIIVAALQGFLLYSGQLVFPLGITMGTTSATLKPIKAAMLAQK
jgi:hypothetical protein